MTSPQRRAAVEAVYALCLREQDEPFVGIPNRDEIDEVLAPFFAAPPAEVAEVAAEVLRLAEKATPGPWDYHPDHGFIHVVPDVQRLQPSVAQTWDKLEQDFDNAHDNGAFIAYCRTAAPLLARAAAATPAREVELLEALVLKRGEYGVELWPPGISLDGESVGWQVISYGTTLGTGPTLAAALAAAAGGRA